MSNAENDFEARLKALQESYASQLPAKLEAINIHWQSLCQRWSPKTAEQLHHLVHGLAGSGGSFGFHQLGSQAREIEIELKGWLKGQITPTPRQLQALGQQLSDLSQAATKAP